MNGSTTIDGVLLDHVAHAVPRWEDVWDRYAFDLGARWSSGGPGPGFAPGQIAFANDARLEMLMPWDVEVNDFLARFLADHGPGAHHLTFKVPRLEVALEQVAAAGYQPIGVDLTNPEWMEAFIHPRQASGVVVQLAEAPVPWSGPPPAGFPTDRRRHPDGTPVAPAELLRVVHAVADLDRAADLFVGVLGGRVDQKSTPDHPQWIEVSWSGSMALRLVTPGAEPIGSPLHRWLGDRPGRIHHLELRVEAPGDLPGFGLLESPLAGIDLRDGAGPAWSVAPEDNAGLRLVARSA